MENVLQRSGPLRASFGTMTGMPSTDLHEVAIPQLLNEGFPGQYVNPFRDRSPEDTASRFLEDLRNGRCTVNDTVCGYALERHRISDWRLRNRVDSGDHVELYFKLTKYGVTEPEHNLTGEGLVELARTSTAWSVVGYSAYF